MLLIKNREQIEPWRRFARENSAGFEPRMKGINVNVGGYGHVAGHEINALTAMPTESGLLVRKISRLSRMIYPAIYLRWKQIESLTEEPHDLTGKPGWEDDMLAVLVLRDPPRRRIVVPWRSQFAKAVPDPVRYVPLSGSSTR